MPDEVKFDFVPCDGVKPGTLIFGPRIPAEVLMMPRKVWEKWVRDHIKEFSIIVCAAPPSETENGTGK